MYQGPDGIPHVREYGNSIGSCSPMINAGEKEPFTDVTRNGDKVSVIVELPGVKKEDIVLEGNKSSLNVTVDTENKKFRKSIALPCDVDEESAHAEYNNGILEVSLTAKTPTDAGRRIAIA
jgi:HSP20 family protein